MKKSVIAIWSVGSLCWAAAAVQAEVTDISGHAAVQVVQFEGGSAIQSDVAQEGLDQSSIPDQALATALLETFATDGSQTAGGSAVAVLRPQATGLLALPNDVGFDVAVFSTDPNIYWQAQGEAVETRHIVLRPRDAGGLLLNGETARFQSRLVLSGAMVVLTNDASLDLSGTEVRFDFSVTKHGGTLADATLLIGSATIVGGPDNSLTVEKSDALAPIPLPIITVPSSVPGLSTVRLIVFPGIPLTYQYDAVIGEEFSLELVTGTHIATSQGGVGAASVFGLPVEGLPNILSRTKRDDSGARISEIVAAEVDTTGQAYLDEGPALRPLQIACGALGLESILPALLATAAVFVPTVRRRRRMRREK